MKNKPFLILLLLLIFLTKVEQTFAFKITGRILSDGVKEKASVIISNAKGEVQSLTTDESGWFETELPEGVYIVRSELKTKGKIYKGFSGKNPIYLNKDEHIGIKLFAVKKPIIKKINSPQPLIKGTLSYENKPVKNGRVYFYLNLMDFKGMPYHYSMPTDKKGKFVVKELLEGSYFVAAKKRSDENPLGPVKEGDMIGFFSSEPYFFKNGYLYDVKINMFVKTKDESPPVLSNKGLFYLKGVIVDKNNKPLKGLYAFAYNKKIIGHERPIALSNRTDNDGKFVLPLPDKGRYYIGVRELFGGTPVQGEYYGLYDMTYDHHIDVDGDIENIIITAEKILK